MTLKLVPFKSLDTVSYSPSIVTMVVFVGVCEIDHVYDFLGWRGGLVEERRTCDLVVAGSRPGRDAAA